jgi:2-dehydro-3-deoxygluconokinase
MSLQIKPTDPAALDLVALGECMIRLSPPGHGRIEFATSLEVWVGGAEYNVAYALARMGLRTAWVGGLNGSPLGRLIANHARAAGVDISSAVMRSHDGIGLRDRIGLNFTEVGISRRGSAVWYDRGHSATAGIRPQDVDWCRLFEQQGVRWLHTGGVYTALSQDSRQVVAAAIQAARQAGTIVSYDLNFRSKLWSSADAIANTRPLLPSIDVLIGNEEDFQNALGYDVEGVDIERGSLDRSAYASMVERVLRDYPNLQAVGTTLRSVKTAQINDWSAILWYDGAFIDGPVYSDLEIEDRVGGGDAFTSGLIYGFLTGLSPQQAVHLGVAHGALVMSTRGDTSQVTSDELRQLVQGGSARIRR